MNFTNTEFVNIDCEKEEIKFYISLSINVGLLLITGIIDGIKKSMSGIVENDIPDIPDILDLEKNIFAN